MAQEISHNEVDDELRKTRGAVRPELHKHHEVFQGFQQAFAALSEMHAGLDDEPDIGIDYDLMDLAAKGLEDTSRDAANRLND